MKAFHSVSAEDTVNIGIEFSKQLKAGDVLLMTGNMGMGKTHFAKGIAYGLDAGDVVSSPTFALVNEYEGRIPIFHFDLFRISDLDELYATGFFDYLERGGITVIEWSENIPELSELIKNAYTISFAPEGENGRLIEIKGRQ